MEQDARQLNGIFQALADPTRRAVLGRLGGSPTSVATWRSRLTWRCRRSCSTSASWKRAGGFGRARWVASICSIEEEPFSAVERWLSEQRALWEGRTDRLQQFVETIHVEETQE